MAVDPEGCNVDFPNRRKTAHRPLEYDGRLGEPENRVHALSRTIQTISEPTAIETGSGRCVIRPSVTPYLPRIGRQKWVIHRYPGKIHVWLQIF